MSFEEYWETDGSRKDAADHKERARLAWEAGWTTGYIEGQLYKEIHPRFSWQNEEEI